MIGRHCPCHAQMVPGPIKKACRDALSAATRPRRGLWTRGGRHRNESKPLLDPVLRHRAGTWDNAVVGPPTPIRADRVEPRARHGRSPRYAGIYRNCCLDNRQSCMTPVNLQLTEGPHRLACRITYSVLGSERHPTAMTASRTADISPARTLRDSTDRDRRGCVRAPRSGPPGHRPLPRKQDTTRNAWRPRAPAVILDPWKFPRIGEISRASGFKSRTR
jgi:hypothetical protein